MRIGGKGTIRFDPQVLEKWVEGKGGEL